MKTLKLNSVLDRELKGKNITLVAKEAGISKSLLHDWYKGRRLPSSKNFPMLLKLARYFGLSLEELLFDKESGSKVTLSSTVFSDGANQYRVEIEKVKQ